jgi:hypothetical protein
MNKNEFEEKEIFKYNRYSIATCSVNSTQDDIRENRKIITHVFRSLSQKKNQPNEILIKDITDLLNQSGKDITKIYDEELNTCNKI